MRAHASRVIAVAMGVLTSAILVAPARADWLPDGVSVCTARGDQLGPKLVSDGAGGAIVTWYDYRGVYYHIYAQRITAAGAAEWTANGVALCTAVSGQQNPSIVSDDAGGAIVTWEDYRSGTTDVYARKVNAAGVPQWTADGVALCTAIYGQGAPTITSDGAGGAIVAWGDNRNGDVSDIYAQRVSATGVPQWAGNGVAVCNAGNEQHFPAAVSDGAGGAIVTWWDFRNGTNYDVYAQRLNAAGVPQWTTDGVALCTAGVDQIGLSTVPDGAGGAIVTWEDYRSGAPHIYAQRVSGAGVPQWTTNGVALCTADNEQHLPAIVPDGGGGAIVAWHDNRTGDIIGFFHIYAQRVSGSGVPQWTKDGLALCTASIDQRQPVIVSDGAGGAIVTWYDVRGSSSWDIYAQRVSAGGVPQWMTNGVVVCSASGDQVYPSMIPDGAGGGIVTWDDYRNGTDSDIYAQRLVPAGALDVPGSSSLGLALSRPSPNPARNGTTVSFALPDAGSASIVVWDAAGRRVRTLVADERLAGKGAVRWDLLDDGGRAVPSGLYFVRLEFAGHSLVQRLVALR
jgi:hypothetical protein